MQFPHDPRRSRLRGQNSPPALGTFPYKPCSDHSPLQQLLGMHYQKGSMSIYPVDSKISHDAVLSRYTIPMTGRRGRITWR
jgi:hypothetical protein